MKCTDVLLKYLLLGSGSKTPAGYADSKLMCSLFAKELQKREPYISVFSVSPGWCKTGLGKFWIINTYSLTDANGYHFQELVIPQK